MAFLIRQVSRTADGREIVRDKRVDAAVVTVGRAGDNDIALPDLAVTAHHVRIERRDGDLVAAVAVGTLGFDVDGRARTDCVIDPAKGAEIALGGHRITITHDDEGLTVLTVARVAAVSDASEERDEAAAFSLKGLLPGKRGSAWVLAIAVLVAFLAVPVWSYVQKSRGERSIYAATADTSWSTGPLSTAHHKLETKCEVCHVKAFVSVRDESCVACHKDTHGHASPARLTQARTAPDFTGRMFQRVATAFGKPLPGACVDCHTEHEGAGPLPPTPQKFCADCHTDLSSRVAGTTLGNAADFATAHPQFRPYVAAAPGTKPTMARASLDTTLVDDSGLKFPHRLHLDRLGGVAQMARTLRGRYGYGNALACKDCHTPTADGVRFKPVEMETSCQGCHSLGIARVGGSVRSLQHGDTARAVAELRALYRWSGSTPVDTGGLARRRPGTPTVGGGSTSRSDPVRAAFTAGGACYDCHTVAPTGSGGWSVTPVHQTARYMKHGWFDHAAHTKSTCTTCHAAATKSDRATDLLLPGIATCRTCHAGTGATAPKVPSTCAMCHSYHLTPGAPWTSRLPTTPATTRRDG